MRALKYGALAAGLILALCGDDCSGGSPTSDQVQNKKQEQLSLQAVESVGLPAITNFAEKRLLKEIYELRDTAITTTTYIVDLNGKLHKFCDSVGYGIPYATEYTNPQRAIEGITRGEFTTLPQADPNGLFSPPSADGTWVVCLDPANAKQTMPVYVEPRVIVSPFPLNVQ